MSPPSPLARRTSSTLAPVALPYRAPLSLLVENHQATACRTGPDCVRCLGGEDLQRGVRSRSCGPVPSERDPLAVALVSVKRTKHKAPRVKDGGTFGSVD